MCLSLALVSAAAAVTSPAPTTEVFKYCVQLQWFTNKAMQPENPSFHAQRMLQ